MRFWFDDEDPRGAGRLARTATARPGRDDGASRSALALAGPLSELLLDHRDATLMDFGVLGLWAFTNLEMAYALLRVEERRRAYLIAARRTSLLTVALTVTLVVGFDGGARGYVLGNYARRRVVLVGLWCSPARRRRRSCPRDVRGLAPAAALRRADGARRRRGLRAQRRRPRLPAARRLAGRGGPVLGVGQARGGRDPRGARLPARVAAARVLGRRRPRGAAALRARHDRLRARDGLRRRGLRRCSGAGPCACSPRPSTTPRTRRCRGWRSAGRSTACSWSSCRSRAARR